MRAWDGTWDETVVHTLWADSMAEGKTAKEHRRMLIYQREKQKNIVRTIGPKDPVAVARAVKFMNELSDNYEFRENPVPLFWEAHTASRRQNWIECCVALLFSWHGRAAPLQSRVCEVRFRTVAIMFVSATA